MHENIPAWLLSRIKFKKPKADEWSAPTSIDIIEYPEVLCDGCGNMVKNRVIQSRKVINPVAHWKHQCKNCKMYENPITGIFDCKEIEVRTHFSNKKKQK
jgi:uncharacterized cysteine cluster protein YcgN (CxxCxxCC family)